VKSIVDTQSPTRVRLVIEVPIEELEPGLKDACREACRRSGVAGQATIAGFRKGKLPFLHAIDQRVGGTVLPQEVETAILTLVSAAVREHEMKPLGRPEIEITELHAGGLLTFAAVVEVHPDVALPDLSAIVVEAHPISVGEADIEESIGELREHLATFELVDHPATTGDIVHIDLRSTIGGVTIEGAQTSDLVYEIGSRQSLAGVDEAIVASAQLSTGLDECLVGLNAGESTTIPVRLVGGEFAGCDADVAVNVIAVKRRHLPEPDDQFASRVGNFITMQELRGDMRERLTQAKKIEQLESIRNSALEQITTASAVTAPQGLLRDEVEHRRQWMHAELRRLGTSLNDYLAAADQTEDQITAELYHATSQRICNQLVLDEFANTENVHISEQDVGEMISHRAQRTGIPTQTYYQQLTRNGAIEAIYTDTRRAKTLSIIMQRVTIKDSNGIRLSLNDL
jgi:trigger factor